MRVAYVCADPGIPVYGRKGASVHVQEVIRALRRRGCAVDLFATRVGGDAPADLSDVPVHPLPPVGKGETAMRERRALAANGELRAALEAEGEAAGGFDMIYERYALWSFAGMSYARAHQVPGLLEVNAPLVEEQARHRALLDRAGAERVAQAVLTTATAVLAVSEPVAQWARTRSTRPERVHVVRNGVDPSRFCVAPRRDPATFAVGFVGTLKPWHGLDTLVAAVGSLAAHDPTVRLLIVGDGPQRGALQQRVDERSLVDATTFTGGVDPADVPGLLARMDVAVAPYPPSDDPYFSPLKLYEYLAAGVPVVASRVGQAAEVVADGVTGLLVEPGDAVALASAVDRLRTNPALRARLGAAGRAAVLSGHTWDAVADRVLALAGVHAAAGVA